MSGQLSVSVSDTGRVSGHCTDAASVADDKIACGGVARGGADGEVAREAMDAPVDAGAMSVTVGREDDGGMSDGGRGAGCARRLSSQMGAPWQSKSTQNVAMEATLKGGTVVSAVLEVSEMAVAVGLYCAVMMMMDSVLK